MLFAVLEHSHLWISEAYLKASARALPGSPALAAQTSPDPVLLFAQSLNEIIVAYAFIAYTIWGKNEM